MASAITGRQNHAANAKEPQIVGESNSKRGSFLSVKSTLNNNNLNNVLKIMVRPLSECKASNISSNHNFNDLMTALKRFEYDYNDMILQPQCGYVIAANRTNNGQLMYINVCHHEKVGLLTTRSKNGKDEYTAGIRSDGTLADIHFPYIIGSINKLHENGHSSSKGDKLQPITIDLVVPSSLWRLLLMSDPTGELREEVSIILLENLSAQQIEFDPDFDLPVVKGGYVSCEDQQVILPVINLSEDEKLRFKVSFVGKFFKQGHGFKSWKERWVHIVDTKLDYYYTNATFKGFFPLDNCSIDFVPTSECNAPADSFAFKISNTSATGDEYLYSYVNNAELRHLFAVVLLCKARQMNIKRDLNKLPQSITGVLKLKGRTWKKKFFVLASGQLKYFDSGPNSDGKLTASQKESGSVNLYKAEIRLIYKSGAVDVSNGIEEFKMVIVEESGKETNLQADNAVDKKLWFESIKLHIHYANGQSN